MMPVRIIAVLPREPCGICVNIIIEPTRHITLMINIVFSIVSLFLEVIS